MKWVLITGSSKGLGKELALVFAENGFNIIVHGREAIALEKVKARVLEKNVECISVIGDLTEEKTIHELEKISNLKNVCLLINNAGYGTKEKLEEMNEEDIEKMITTNLIAPIQLIKRIYNILKKNKGHIINMNSISGMEAQEGRTIYCAAKWGLRGFTDALRLEALNDNIKILGVYPRKILTKPEFKYGVKPEDFARKIFKAYESGDKELILNNLSPEYKT